MFIAKAKVRAIMGNQVEIGDVKLPLGRSVREEVLSQLVGGNILRR